LLHLPKVIKSERLVNVENVNRFLLLSINSDKLVLTNNPAMKKSFLYFMMAFMGLLNLPVLATAQADFAPIGAKWHYSSGTYNVGPSALHFQGYVFQESVSDTVINGITARKLQRTYSTRNTQNTIFSGPISSIYIYATADTIFSYNVDSNRFMPLYIFNVAVGDTLTHHSIGAPVYPLFVNTWQTVVDSIRYPVFNGKQVKAVYHHEVSPIAGWGSSPYYQYFGQLQGEWGIYYQQPALPEDYYTRYGLRCYQDDSFDVHFANASMACDSVPPGPTSIADVDFLSRKLSVYPNPATDQVTIMLDGIAIQSVEVLDMLGRRVLLQEYKAGTNKTMTDLSNVSKGTYILRINTKDQGSVYRKIVLK
jgi:hypothetical protein